MGRSDMFLKATGQKSGEVVGESNDKNFPNQIDIVEWSWGMTAPSAITGERTGRVQLQELKLVKRVDKASTALMSVLSVNEIMPNVTLTVRKASGTGPPLPYFVIKLAQARINSYQVQSEAGPEGTPLLTEHLTMSFKTITVEYTQQSSTGAAVGASSFTGQAGPNT